MYSGSSCLILQEILQIAVHVRDSSVINSQFDVPVLLITWRRPHTTAQVIESLRKVRPNKIFVASDGAANPDEEHRVFETRQLINSMIDWDCDIYTRFSDVNQGCRRGVSSAISWFFENVEEGIILEDDCVPHFDFFLFCKELLHRFRDDSRIWCISGDNFQEGHWRSTGSYYFSKYNHCWGWATWRRCWAEYNDNLTNLTEFCESDLLSSTYPDPCEQEYWKSIWSQLKVSNVPDSWAYRWAFTCISNGGLTILPNVNLVHNIGFGEDALHTKDHRFLTPATSEGIMPLTHPLFIVANSAADQYTFDHHFGGHDMKLAQRYDKLLLKNIKQIIKRGLHLFFK